MDNYYEKDHAPQTRTNKSGSKGGNNLERANSGAKNN